MIVCTQEYFLVLYGGWLQKWDGGPPLVGRCLRIKCLGGVEEQLTGKLGLGAWEELQQLENAKVGSQLKKSEEIEFSGNQDIIFKHHCRYFCCNSIPFIDPLIDSQKTIVPEVIRE